MTSKYTLIDANDFAKCFSGMCIQLHSLIGAAVGGDTTIQVESTIKAKNLGNCISLRAELGSTPLSTNSIILELTICGVGDLLSQDQMRKEWLASLTKSLANSFANSEK